MYISLYAAEVILQPPFINDKWVWTLRGLKEIIIVVFISRRWTFDVGTLGTC